MNQHGDIEKLSGAFIRAGDHAGSDYFGLVRELVALRILAEKGSEEFKAVQAEIDRVYGLISDELTVNRTRPVSPIKFGTSGWRGIIGKDIFVKSVQQVTSAVVRLFREAEENSGLAEALGIKSLAEVKKRGCVLGFDNRFGGEVLARAACDVLTGNGIRVYYAGESTTGVLSATLLELSAAFSINLTPSHNPLEYGGYKFNGADGGPASSLVTNRITEIARELVEKDTPPECVPENSLVEQVDSLDCWVKMVRKNSPSHRVDYDDVISRFAGDSKVVLAVDCVHGASRLHIRRLLQAGGSGENMDRLMVLRGESDQTFGGIAPEPSSANMKPVMQALADRSEELKLGAVIDPDGDRVRLTDGTVEIDMNQFGAMSYHFLHEHKGLQGMVAKTVATSNFANRLAQDFKEEVFESRVGFKEFKPVMGRALVCFEESDGISVIGHTPEKDAYIGLLLALDMVLMLRKNLGKYLREIQEKHGYYFPAKDGVVVSSHGEKLLATLSRLEKYGQGTTVRVGEDERVISGIIDIDGRKMVFDDGSWLMIRPSGTEPKVRFYVEARDKEKQLALFAAAREMLTEIGLL